MSDVNSDQTYFDTLVEAASAKLTGDEVLLANIAGERTDFIRLNNSDVRQAGSIDQRTLTVDLVEGQRHTGGSIRLSGDRSVDDGHDERAANDYGEFCGVARRLRPHSQY